MIDILSLKKEHLIVGRGATAIYLALKNADIQHRQIVVPANVCYAAVFPILLSGNTPIFCDVDRFSGNLTTETVKSVVSSETAAILVPHMYGNPVNDLPEIMVFAKENDLIVIEDCASCMGAESSYGPVGVLGDYVIYSTGHSKTINIGNGGLLCSNNDLTVAKENYHDLPFFSESIENDLDLFSRFYRLIRNQTDTRWAKHVYQGLSELSRHLFLYRATPELEEAIRTSLAQLELVIEKRREGFYLYRSLLEEKSFLKSYSFSQGAVPWRYNILVDREKRHQLISYLLDNRVSVSDWYPTVTDIFFCDKTFENAQLHADMILNFPLPCEKQEIERICNLVNHF